MHRHWLNLEAMALVASLTLIFFGLGVIGISESDITSPKAPQAHREAVCADCHQLVASANSQERFQADMDAPCVGCHTNLASQTSNQLGFHRQIGKPCSSCHSFHQTDYLTAGEQLVIFDFDQPALENHCASCHSPGQSVTNLSQGHIEAAQYYHSNAQSLTQISLSDACLACHSIDQAATPASSATSDAPRFFVHASHPYGISYRPRRGRGSLSTVLPSSSDVKLIDGRIECQTCHSLTRTPRTAFLESTTEGGLCVACHVSNS